MLVELQAAACGASLGMVPTGHGFSIWSQVSHRIFEFVRAE